MKGKEEKNKLGKLDREDFRRLIAPELEVGPPFLVPPAFGQDFGAIRLDEDGVLVVSSDPLAINPQLGWKRSGRLALQVVASDVALSGIAPEFISTNWNLPPEVSGEDFRAMWKGFCETARAREIKIAGGHTGRYGEATLPIVGGGTAFGLGKKADLLSGEPRAGDELVLFNKLGLEAAGILAFYFPEKVSSLVGPEAVQEAKLSFDSLDPVLHFKKLARTAGAKAVHDLAEGGLLGGLQELLGRRKDGPGLRLKTEKIEIKEAVGNITRSLDLDPLKITSTGSALVLLDCQAEKYGKKLQAEGLEVTPLGRLTASGEIELERQGEISPLKKPVQDSFWEVFGELNREKD